MSTESKPPRHSLEGWVPQLAAPEEVRSAFEKAFDYRGDVTLTLKDGQIITGYVFDRRSDGPGLAQCLVRLFPRDGSGKMEVRYSDIARLEFSGRDTAAGKSFDLWVRKYAELKARGEKNISLAPELLD